jgi:hypothetical protein
MVVVAGFSVYWMIIQWGGKNLVGKSNFIFLVDFSDRSLG